MFSENTKLVIRCCGKDCADTDSYEAHLVTKHYNLAPFKCEQCFVEEDRNSSFATIAQVKKHYSNDHKTESFRFYASISPEMETSFKEISQLVEKERSRVSASNQRNRINAFCSDVKEKELGCGDAADSKVEVTRTLSEAAATIGLSAHEPAVRQKTVDSALMPPPMTVPNSRKRKLSHESLGETTSESNSANTLNRSKLNCAECKKFVEDDMESMKVHVNTMHLKYNLYVCMRCNRNFRGRRSKALKHISVIHKGDDTLLDDHTEKYAKRIEKEVCRYFPSVGAAVASPHSSESRQIPSQTPAQVGNGSLLGARQTLRSALSNASSTSTSVKKDSTFHVSFATPKSPLLNSTAPPAPKKNAYQRHRCSSVLPTKQAPARISNFLQRSSSVSENDIFLNRIPRETGKSASSLPNNVLEGIFGPKPHIRQHEIRCRQCETMVRSYFDYQIVNHVNSEHLKFSKLFECLGCGFSSSDFSGAKMSYHTRANHGGDKSLIKDNRDVYREELEKECCRAFQTYHL